jgi:acetyl-CoA carboxylase biotin carboxyl carrier protein
MNTQHVRRLTEALTAAGMEELDLRFGSNNRIHLVLNPTAASLPNGTGREKGGPSGSAPTPQPIPILDVRSERVGLFTFGKAPKDAGRSVKKGEVLGIIKGISIQDQVISPETGTLSEVLVSEGMIVEFGQILFRISR